MKCNARACAGHEATVVLRCAAVEAMPDFAGRTAREDGKTHRCEGCGAGATVEMFA